MCICVFAYLYLDPQGTFRASHNNIALWCTSANTCYVCICVNSALQWCSVCKQIPGEWTINRRRDINHKQIDTDGMHISTVENRYRLTAHLSTEVTPMRLGSWLFPIVYFHMFPQNVCSRRFIVTLFAQPSTEVNPMRPSSWPTLCRLDPKSQSGKDFAFEHFTSAM